MPLIFNDTLQATDSTGIYTLQALVDGSWTDIHTIAGVHSGSIPVDGTLNTIPVDTTLLPVGHTFQFRWVDSIGNESNTVPVLVPFTILDYYTSNEDITYANNGGDSWTFTVPYTPPANDPADILVTQIDFLNDSGSTVLVNGADNTSTQSYTFTGNGPGTYEVQTIYVNSNGTHIVIAAAIVMVDGAGNVLRDLIITGFSDVSFSGMNLSCTANYQVTNANVTLGAYIAFDEQFNNQQFISLTNPLVNQQVPSYSTPNIIIAYGIQLDQSEWTAGVAAPGAPTGCGMTLITDIL